jgi:hypothetical protein
MMRISRRQLTPFGQRGSAISPFRRKNFQYFALVIHGPPLIFTKISPR